MSENPVQACESNSTKKMLLQDNSWTTSLDVHVILLKTKKGDKHPPCVVPMTKSCSLINNHNRWLDMIVRTSLSSAL